MSIHRVSGLSNGSSRAAGIDNMIRRNRHCLGRLGLRRVAIRQILGVTGINDYVVAPLLTYAALVVSATLLAWLFWFGH